MIIIKVYALVGSSGTGKSYKALNIAKLKDIEYIIDDGILISHSKKIGGFSAKKESTKMAAVKRAIFHFSDHREEMKSLIEKEQPESLLIIGTSNKMVKQIADNLGISPIDHIYQIEDVSSADEINKALLSRRKDGKHVIPLPTVEVKKDFSGYFMDKLKILVKKKGSKSEIAEKTIIRPTFSYIGHYSISMKALLQIISFSLYGNPGVFRFIKGRIIEDYDGIAIICEVSVTDIHHLLELGREVQKLIKRNVEDMTGLNVKNVQVNIRNINIL
ncbi:MAG: Asp23/Gls24 family envelope stress response protein [Clostridiales bacterium]|nr:Asp23/Gls24 family envelope stress response protein [Clostridiales bacterium]